MRTYRKEFAEELNRTFPKTPETFRQAVVQEVREQMTPKKNRRRRKKKLYKALIPLAACLILAGGTVVAANLPVFQDWLAGTGSNAVTIEPSIIHSGEAEEPISMGVTPESETEISDNDPLFTVTDVYYDGSTLIFWADPKNDFFSLGDHVYINGIDSRLEYVVETEEGSGIYECMVSVVNNELQETDVNIIHVDVSVYTSPNSKSDFSFTVESDKLSASAHAAGSVSDLAFGQLISYNATLAPSIINLHLEWEVNEAGKEILQFGDYILMDASGKRLARNEWLRSCSCSIPEYTETGACTFSQDLEIKGFDASSPTITLIPVRVEWDADGMQIPGSEEVLEDYAITLDLTN